MLHVLTRKKARSVPLWLPSPRSGARGEDWARHARTVDAWPHQPRSDEGKRPWPPILLPRVPAEASVAVLVMAFVGLPIHRLNSTPRTCRRLDLGAALYYCIYAECGALSSGPSPVPACEAVSIGETIPF